MFVFMSSAVFPQSFGHIELMTENLTSAVISREAKPWQTSMRGEISLFEKISPVVEMTKK